MPIRNLNQFNILVTRPNPQGMELCLQIRAHGGHAIHLPTIFFAPPLNPYALDQAINKLTEQDWLIFISPYAVNASVSLIRKHWPELPARAQCAAIGAGTYKALKQAGFRTVICPPGEWNSEALLALPEFQQLAQKKIAIVRGENGRELLTNILTERGAEILPVIAYQRMLPNIDMYPYLNLAKEKKVDVIVCASFESVRNLKLLFDDEGWPFIEKLPVIVVSERIKTLAGELGFQTIWVARNASHDAILEALEHIKYSHSADKD